MRLHLIVLLSFFNQYASADKVPPEFALQRVIRLKSPAEKNRIRAKVPRKVASVLGGGKSFLVIRPEPRTSPPLTKLYYAALAKEPGVAGKIIGPKFRTGELSQVGKVTTNSAP